MRGFVFWLESGGEPVAVGLVPGLARVNIVSKM